MLLGAIHWTGIKHDYFKKVRVQWKGRCVPCVNPLKMASVYILSYQVTGAVHVFFFPQCFIWKQFEWEVSGAAQGVSSVSHLH